MKFKSILIVVAVFFLSTGWTIRNLGTLPGGLDSSAFGINDRGQIVGDARTADGAWRAVFWDAGGAIFPIPTTADKDCCESFAFEINEGATVVGIIQSADGRSRRAFLWKPGAPLATELQFGRESHGHSINNFGDTVGWGYELDWSQHALSWRGAGASVEDIGSLGGGFTEPRDVADGPVVVGYAHRPPVRRPFRRAFLWVTGGHMRDLGTLGGDNSEAFGVTVGRWPDPTEETIYVVGHSEIMPGEMTTRAFLWHRGVMTELPTVKGCDFYEARAINKNRDIVGRCGSSSGGASRALLWSGGAVHVLNDLLPPGSGWNLNTAFDINERGEIVGVGMFEGATRGFVMEP